jgi:DNA-binding SARP family transcriptional activator/tetratricopeptide (TPR) repeat protein
VRLGAVMPLTLGRRPSGFLVACRLWPLSAPRRDDDRVVSRQVGEQELEFRLFGRFVVLRGGAEVPVASFGGRKVRTLLRILVTRRGRFLPHDILAERLWPDRLPADPAANLQVLVNRARRAVGRPDLILTGPGGYALTAQPWLLVDVDQHLEDLRRCADLTGPRALRAYRAALAVGDAEPLAEDRYTSWAAPYVDAVLQARQSARERAVVVALACGQPTQALEWARAAHRAEPLREVAALALVRALAAVGDPAAALSTLAAYRHRLAEELGVDPSPAAAALELQLLSSGIAPTPAAPEPSSFVELPFVGREAELAGIRHRLRPEVGTSVIAVNGHSGTGKSRLLAEIARTEHAITVRAFWADRDEAWALGRALLGELAAADFTTVNALPDQVRTALATVLPDLAPGAGPLDPASRLALVLEAGVRLTTALDRPLLMIDDLQWADPTSLRLLAALHARVPGLRLLLACRPDEVPPDSAVGEFLRRTVGGQPVDLGPLTVSAITRLMPAPELAAALGLHTDRSPLAVTEVVRELAATGAIVLDGQGKWQEAVPSVSLVVADLGARSQRRTISARAGRFSGAPRSVLALLALLGREAPAHLLAAAISADEGVVLEALGRLADAQLVRQRQQGWGLVHDAVGDVLVSELTTTDRVRWQARLAAALDGTQGDEAERARLWRDAGDRDRAATRYAAAARRAVDNCADAEAVRLATDGLALVAGSGELAGPRCTLHEVRGLARQHQGDLPGARADLSAALRDAGSGPRRAVLLAELAALISGSEDLVRASELAELALVEAGADEAARARALEVASVIDMNIDHPARARRRAATALEIFGRLGDSHGAARILDARAMATFLDSDIRRGCELLNRAAHLFADSGDLMRLVTPRSTRGHGLVLLGRPADGLLDADAALETARTLGHPEGQAYALWHRGEALAALGRAELALSAGTEALAIATRIGHRGWTATSWRTIGLAEQCGGDHRSALQAFEHSLAAAEHLDLFACWAAARAALAQLQLGQVAPAAELVRRALVTGPALGRHEARWADAALAAHRGEERGYAVIRAAMAEAVSGGALMYLPALEALRTELSSVV